MKQQPFPIDELQRQIGLQFMNPLLLIQAFTHRSYLNEHRDERYESYERLEYLGDKVLGLVVADHLFENVLRPEGELTELCSVLVCNQALTQVGDSLDIMGYIRFSRGEAVGSPRSHSYVLACVVEALIGAIYKDRGYLVAKLFIETHILSQLEMVLATRGTKDPKSRLQELVQGLRKSTPEYRTLEVRGPDHDRAYRVGVFVDGELWAEGEGSSITVASKQAAAGALEAKNPMRLRLLSSFADELSNSGLDPTSVRARIERLQNQLKVED